MTEDASRDRALSAYLAEYDKLRAEQFTRMETQNHTFNFALLVLAAGIGAVVSLATGQKAEAVTPGILAVCLLLPLLGCPLAFKFFDNEILIHAVGSYLFRDRRLRIREAVGDDSFNIRRISEFIDLPDHTRSVWWLASVGKWFLFAVPTFLPTAIALLYGGAELGQLHATIPPAVIVVSFGILALDIALCAALIPVMRWVWINRRFQRGLGPALEEDRAGLARIAKLSEYEARWGLARRLYKPPLTPSRAPVSGGVASGTGRKRSR
ncbi:hypothetical protein [Naasia sp. SYSU D00948]|uniref:hypothetical protein n=1 Tax=Naasia sp. SYSU D00948 TaxID=2817379 RepID=UPI001B30FA33|nr:hypothetical protein [Naasia sp. SYSU D00948]